MLTTKVNEHLKRLAQCSAGYVVRIGNVQVVSQLLTGLTTTELSEVILIVNFRNSGLQTCLKGRCYKVPVCCLRGPCCTRAGGVCSLFLTQRRLTSSSALLLRSSVIFRGEVLREILRRPCPGMTMMSHCGD